MQEYPVEIMSKDPVVSSIWEIVIARQSSNMGSFIYIRFCVNAKRVNVYYNIRSQTLVRFLFSPAIPPGQPLPLSKRLSQIPP